MRGYFYFHLPMYSHPSPIKPIKTSKTDVVQDWCIPFDFQQEHKEREKSMKKYTQIISIPCRMNKSYTHKASFLIQPFRTQMSNTVSTTETSFTVEAKRSKDSSGKLVSSLYQTAAK